MLFLGVSVSRWLNPFYEAHVNKRFHPLAAILILTLAVLACALPGGNGGNQPSSPDEVATIVASTLQALTPVVADVPTEAPAPAGMLLHSFYYLGNDKT